MQILDNNNWSMWPEKSVNFICLEIDDHAFNHEAPANISRGSVMTCLRCGRITDLLQCLTMKNFEISQPVMSDIMGNSIQ